mmetsp:Transcript_58151/g.135442  ORF Transcript_58151/g.135442 Transcript_58151/m.135442 type:complete len:223 (+) Transcript_58151:237-905(+)
MVAAWHSRAGHAGSPDRPLEPGAAKRHLASGAPLPPVPSPRSCSFAPLPRSGGHAPGSLHFEGPPAHVHALQPACTSCCLLAVRASCGGAICGHPDSPGGGGRGLSCRPPARGLHRRCRSCGNLGPCARACRARGPVLVELHSPWRQGPLLGAGRKRCLWLAGALGWRSPTCQLSELEQSDARCGLSGYVTTAPAQRHAARRTHTGNAADVLRWPLTGWQGC